MINRNRRRFRPKLAKNDKYYTHIVSRFVNRDFILKDLEKVQFLQLLRRYEAFGRLRVVSYCLMSNHFHVLVEVTARPEVRPGEGELLAHVEETLGKKIADSYRWRLEMVREGVARDLAQQAALIEADASLAGTFAPTHNQAVFEKVLEDIWRRMYDVSCLIQSVKQQFTNWYNKRVDRRGTLWEERFRSTIVQGGAAVTEMAAYIDLNPVRAGIVDDPKDYRWSQYGAAMGGDKVAQKAVADVCEMHIGLTVAEKSDWMATQGRYRVLLYRRGLIRPTAEGGITGVFDAGVVEKVAEEKGRISGISYAAMRVRYFTDGLVIGSKDYVDRLFQENRDRFGAKRKSGARKMTAVEGGDWGGLRSLRDLKKDVILNSKLADY